MDSVHSSIESLVNTFSDQLQKILPYFESPLIEKTIEFVNVNRCALMCGLFVGGTLTWYRYCDTDFTLFKYQLIGSSPKNKLANKVIWITGASSGIGEALAYELASKVPNCRLVLTGTNEAKLKEVAAKCQNLAKSSSMTLVLPMDMRRADSQADGAVDKVISTFGQLDVLVNNAGRSQRALFHQVSTDVDREMFEINVFGGIKLTRSAIEHWKSVGKKDAIVAVTSSIAGKIGAPFSCTYTATKFALHGYFECLRIEEYPWLSVVMVCPGPVVSAVVENAFTSQPGEKWNKKHADDSTRISTDRCAKLFTLAMANRMDEVWISRNPILLSVYLYQYFPSCMRRYFTGFFSRSFMKLRDGEVSISSQ